MGTMAMTGTINVKNKPNANTTCDQLYNLSTVDGAKILEEMQRVIDNLEKHWIGDDASKHQNKLRAIYKRLGNCLDDAIKYSALAGNSIKKLLSVSNANVGLAGMDMLSMKTLNKKTYGELKEAETRWYCEPGTTSTDYQNLTELSKSFAEFRKKFIGLKDDLMSNWIDGMDRQSAYAAFERFSTDSSKDVDTINTAAEYLNVAIQNISQL